MILTSYGYTRTLEWGSGPFYAMCSHALLFFYAGRDGARAKTKSRAHWTHLAGGAAA